MGNTKFQISVLRENYLAKGDIPIYLQSTAHKPAPKIKETSHGSNFRYSAAQECVALLPDTAFSPQAKYKPVGNSRLSVTSSACAQPALK